MFRRHHEIAKQLSAYCHGELTAAESHRVSTHLSGCHQCQKTLDEIKLVASLAGQLKRVSAPSSVWSEIESSLNSRSLPQAKTHSAFAAFFSRRNLVPLSACLLLFVLCGAIWIYTRAPKKSWEVTRLEGAPAIGTAQIGSEGHLGVGEWLETDQASRASISVADIGRVEVEPNTRVSLLDTRASVHRLALAQGKIHAVISAPPRLFLVETPSAVAVDYGCAYTLEVNETGGSLLHVNVGWVALELNNRQAMIPGGYLCETRPRLGPGTPYAETASQIFRENLARYDFEHGGQAALITVLSEATVHDGLSLWYLLPRVGSAERELVYARLAKLIEPPPGVTREGILKLDERMLDLWKEKID